MFQGKRISRYFHVHFHVHFFLTYLHLWLHMAKGPETTRGRAGVPQPTGSTGSEESEEGKAGKQTLRVSCHGLWRVFGVLLGGSSRKKSLQLIQLCSTMFNFVQLCSTMFNTLETISLKPTNDSILMHYCKPSGMWLMKKIGVDETTRLKPSGNVTWPWKTRSSNPKKTSTHGWFLIAISDLILYQRLLPLELAAWNKHKWRPQHASINEQSSTCCWKKTWTFHLNDRCQGSFIKAKRNETMAARASHPCPCTRRRAIAQRQNQKWSQ